MSLAAENSQAQCSIVPTYKLKGHQSAVLCCTSAGSRVVSGAEDGVLLIHDIESAPCAASSFSAESTGTKPGPNASTTTTLPSLKPLYSVSLRGADGQAAAVASVASNPLSPETSIFAAAGSLVQHVDLRTGAVVQTYSNSKDEVNGLCVNAKGAMLAAGDDAGEAQVYDLTAGRLFKSIRNVHSNICSSVAFRAHKPWDLLTGGLDCTLAKYDFSRPKCIDRWDMNALTAAAAGSAGSGSGGGGQIFNPPFVHQLTVPPADNQSACHWVAAARGDGAVVVLDADVSSVASGASGPTTQVVARGRAGGRGGAAHGTMPRGSAVGKRGEPMQPLVLDRDLGGHTMPVCCVAFAPCSSPEGHAAVLDTSKVVVPAGGCRLYSAGEDRRVILWDVGAALGARAAGMPLVNPRAVACGGRLGAADGVEGLSTPQRGEAVAREPNSHGTRASSNEEEGAVAGINGDGRLKGGTAVLAEVQHGRKVNQLCCMKLGGQELVAVASVSKFVMVYQTHLGT